MYGSVLKMRSPCNFPCGTTLPRFPNNQQPQQPTTSFLTGLIGHCPQQATSPNMLHSPNRLYFCLTGWLHSMTQDANSPILSQKKLPADDMQLLVQCQPRSITNSHISTMYTCNPSAKSVHSRKCHALKPHSSQSHRRSDNQLGYRC